VTIALQFLGAARHVTGTKHLVEVGDKKVLLDCGLVQGPRKVADKANRNLPIGGGDVDALVLSHAHIDHCGALPRLVKDGYSGNGRLVLDVANGMVLLPKNFGEIEIGDDSKVRRLDARPTSLGPAH